MENKENPNKAKAEKRKNVKSPERRIFSALKAMETLRRDHPAFDDAADTWLVPIENDAVLGIGRYYEKEQVLGIYNFSLKDETIWLRDPKEYEDLISKEKKVYWKFTLRPGEFLWLSHKF